MGRKDWVVLYSRPIPPGGWSTNMRIMIITEVLLKERGVWASHQTPNLGDPVPGTQAPRTLGFEDQQNLLSGEPESCGNRDSTLKGSTQNLTALRYFAEAVIWKDPVSHLPADLGEFPGESRGNWSSLWGIDTANRHFWKLILSRVYWCW